MKPLDRPDTLMPKAAEKLLKALLARRGLDYRRTHDLFELLGRYLPTTLTISGTATSCRACLDKRLDGKPNLDSTRLKR